jgi:DnaK suppressor protein
MEESEARSLLNQERTRVRALLQQTVAAGAEDRAAALEPGDMTDPAGPLVDEQLADDLAAGLRDRLDAIDRAEQRLSEGTYGLSIRSGLPIPDERLRADPAAELTVEEAAAGE